MEYERWKYLEELDDDVLLAEIDKSRDEIDSMIETLDDPDASSNEKSEIRNSDLPYEEEKLQVMESIARSRGLVKGL